MKVGRTQSKEITREATFLKDGKAITKTINYTHTPEKPYVWEFNSSDILACKGEFYHRFCKIFDPRTAMHAEARMQLFELVWDSFLEGFGLDKVLQKDSKDEQRD